MKISNNPKQRQHTQNGHTQYFNQSENVIDFSIVFMLAKTIVYMKKRVNKIQRECLSSENSNREIENVQ